LLRVVEGPSHILWVGLKKIPRGAKEPKMLGRFKREAGTGILPGATTCGDEVSH